MSFDLSIFNPGARPLMGLDVSSSAVKLVELSRTAKGEHRIERYASENLPRDAALPAAAVITKKIIVPANQREQELEVLVESEANQYIPFQLDEVNLDFQVVGPAPGSPDEVEVLIAASRKEKVEDRVAVAEAAGLRALVVDVESYAAQAAFELVERQLPDGGRDANIVLVDVGANVMNVIILRNDQPVYSREQAFGGYQLTQDIMRNYGMSPEEAEAAKRTNTLPENYENDLLRPFMDNLALEVSRALQFFFTSTQYNSVDHIVMAGGCSVIPGLDEVVANRTQVETRVANPFVDMQLAPAVTAKRLSQDAPSLLVACGLALRRFDA